MKSKACCHFVANYKMTGVPAVGLSAKKEDTSLASCSCFVWNVTENLQARKSCRSEMPSGSADAWWIQYPTCFSITLLESRSSLPQDKALIPRGTKGKWGLQMRKSSITGGDRISLPIRLMWDRYDTVGFSFYFVMQEYSRVCRCAPCVCPYLSVIFSRDYPSSKWRGGLHF